MQKNSAIVQIILNLRIVCSGMSVERKVHGVTFYAPFTNRVFTFVTVTVYVFKQFQYAQQKV